MIGERIRQLRETNQMLLRELAAQMQMDTAMLSKMERSERPFKKEDILALSKIFNQPHKELLTLWLADQVFNLVKNEDQAKEALDIAKSKLENKNNLK